MRYASILSPRTLALAATEIVQRKGPRGGMHDEVRSKLVTGLKEEVFGDVRSAVIDYLLVNPDGTDVLRDALDSKIADCQIEIARANGVDLPERE